MAQLLTSSILIAVLVGQVGPEPQPLATFLRHNPQFHLLREDELGDERDDIVRDRAFSPYVSADATGDGRPETFAVVLSGHAPSVKYGAVALSHGGSKALWLIRPTEKPLVGIRVDGNRVWPLHCYGCDSNDFLRWNGRGYEWRLWVVGEEVALYGHTDGQVVVVRERPTERARPVVQVTNCASPATIIGVQPISSGHRWYKIDAMGLQGFVRDDDVTEISCIG